MAILNKSLLGLTVLGVSLALAGNALAQGYSYERPRKLAPGTIIEIKDANIDDATLDETREFTELLDVVRPPEWTPNFDPTTDTLLDKAKRVSFQRDVWSLDFGFKPLRVINVGGQNYWYLVFFVRNSGEVRSPSVVKTSIEIKGKQQPIRFIPSFVLQGHDTKRTYRDTIRPGVVSMIASKERVTRGQLHDAASIRSMEIPVSTPTADRRVWGVAVWENVDPRTDYITVFVQGLTNAYRWQPPKDGYKNGMEWMEQDVVQSKALQLNFWRAGDAIDLTDNEFSFGIPLYPNDPVRQSKVLRAYKLDKPIRHRWVYR